MRKNGLLLFFLFSCTLTWSQSLEGRWKGFYTYGDPIRITGQNLFSEKTVKTVKKKSGETISDIKTVPNRAQPSQNEKSRHLSRVQFEVNCIFNPDSTYQFQSFTGEPVMQWNKMEYEIIGNDTLYLVEVGENGQDIELMGFQKMMLKISWIKKNGKKLLQMKGPWYEFYGSSKMGEVLLIRED